MVLTVKIVHLKFGQISFPPEVGLNTRSHGGQSVVGVHDDVDEGVEQSTEGFVAAWKIN